MEELLARLVHDFVKCLLPSLDYLLCIAQPGHCFFLKAFFAG